jgi:hypothetical protein
MATLSIRLEAKEVRVQAVGAHDRQPPTHDMALVGKEQREEETEVRR